MTGMFVMLLAGGTGAEAQNFFPIDSAASMEAAVPGGLVYFNALGMSRSAVLTWATAAAAKGTRFEIERAPTEDGDWQMVGSAESSGTVNASRRYTYTDRDVPADKMWYRLKQVDSLGRSAYSRSIEVSVTKPPEEFTLEQNYPNPFNPTTTIAFDLPTEEFVRLNVFDALGQEVASLIDAVRSAGHHSVTFDASQLNAGIYLYRLDAGSFSRVRRMILLK